jgi:serine-type D-Ala-D-Ala carboxypeptidase (penicillin-binding protein 5/6)
MERVKSGKTKVLSTRESPRREHGAGGRACRVRLLSLPYWMLGLTLASLVPGPAGAEDRDLSPSGVPILVRPGAKIPAKEETNVDPKDPLAPEKAKLRDWEKALNATADSLTERLRVIVERERMLSEKEREFMQRVGSLDAREEALAAREALVRARETMPNVKPWSGPTPPNIVGRYATVIDAVDGRILFRKGAYEKVPVASTQKLMTALLIVEAGNLDQEVVIQESDTEVEPTALGFRAGETYKRADLLRWLLVKSGNDCAVALARDNAGSVEAFCKKMNAKAQALGMTDSLFKNPNGLPLEGQHSTARDMALLAWECYQQPFIRECVKLKTVSLTLGSVVVREGSNTNKLLRENSSCNGMKTGFTYAAGNCLISSGVRDERERIVVVLHSSGSSITRDSELLLEWALNSD